MKLDKANEIAEALVAVETLVFRAEHRAQRLGHDPNLSETSLLRIARDEATKGRKALEVLTEAYRGGM